MVETSMTETTAEPAGPSSIATVLLALVSLVVSPAVMLLQFVVLWSDNETQGEAVLVYLVFALLALVAAALCVAALRRVRRAENSPDSGGAKMAKLITYTALAVLVSGQLLIGFIAAGGLG